MTERDFLIRFFFSNQNDNFPRSYYERYRNLVDLPELQLSKYDMNHNNGFVFIKWLSDEKK